MGSTRFLFVAGAVLMMAAVAPTGARAAEKGAGSDALSPAELGNLPSLRETGRIGAMSVQQLGAATTGIQPVPAVGDSGEKSIQPAAARVDVPPPPRVGTVDPETLRREVQERLAALDDCRIEVARRQRVSPADVRADTLTLRWVIRLTGEAASTEVVATSPTDLEVMDCVKARMSTWSFTPPRGGPLPVTRDFRFRPVP